MVTIDSAPFFLFWFVFFFVCASDVTPESDLKNSTRRQSHFSTIDCQTKKYLSCKNLSEKKPLTFNGWKTAISVQSLNAHILSCRKKKRISFRVKNDHTLYIYWILSYSGLPPFGRSYLKLILWKKAEKIDYIDSVSKQSSTSAEQKSYVISI